MAFEVFINDEAQHPIVILKDVDNGTQAEIYSFGALLNKFSKIHQGQQINVIEGYDSVELARADLKPGFKSAKLSPFACRIKNAKYSFGDREHKLSKYNVNESALHGLIFDQVFSIIETEATDDFARLVLQSVYDNPNEGFPFLYRCEIEYRLKKDHTLCIKTTITNIDDQLLPITDGWHPYFTLGDKINECQLEFQSTHKLEFDADLLPTGKLEPYQEYGSIKTLGDTQLDNCFTANFAECQPMAVFRNPKKNIQVEIHPAASYPYLQFFTPPHRNSIAIENLSAPPDAFNNAMGLQVLEPAETATFSTKFIIKSL